MTQTTLHCGECVAFMRGLPNEYIDLTVTSPPYDDLRDYKGYSFDFENVAKELYRITKNGGVVVWIVADATIKGSETGTSFRQALHFMSLGFRLHDTMIWNKKFAFDGSKNRYSNVFEYMFVFSRGNPTKFNAIYDRKNISAGRSSKGTRRQKNGETQEMDGGIIEPLGARFNIWDQFPVMSNKERTGHPAQFPERLIRDHIITWSDKNDLVLDPFMGSGTSGVACALEGRNFIGIEIGKEYFDIANKRIYEAKFADLLWTNT